MSLESSELVLNADGSVYHLNLKPEHLAETVITVGDPGRVDKITRYFDEVEFKIQKREFHTHTGTYKGKRITVISTGIGPDNIDIVLNELDALANIDFETRQIKDKLTSLEIIRIGTSGSIQEEIPVDSILMSENSVGFDGVLHFYDSKDIDNTRYADALAEHMNWYNKKSYPYVVSCDEDLASKFHKPEVFKGTTATNIGFYGPQGRALRLQLQDEKMNDKLGSFEFEGKKITNLEMETSAIYALSKLLGHKALSMNIILANRPSGKFASAPGKSVEKLIQFCLDRLAE
ncbi:nucleoside phosphorylase [Salegentibacter chungangensis]|uniref:Uridine phosphorylase n=1 Tax=Salegentibacter chungangensis TaxID=1335724 RepID=A0ABW3NTE8_9FLAO